MVDDASLVMIVEDDDDFRGIMTEVLAEAGYRVVSARDGSEALARLRGGLRPTVMLLDLWMPEMDGWQLRRRMQMDPELAKIPVVVVTAAAQASDAPSMAVTEVLRKPVPLRNLLALLERYCAA
jgi:two-component system, chemotaxis family, chemotaxis protein CheY